MKILDEAQQKLLKDERLLLNDLRTALVELGAAPEDQKTLGGSIQQLDDLFLIVVVGEFNSGKSSLINALVGQKILKEGVTPTTAQINILRFGEQVERSVENENLHILKAPAAILNELSIVDTPGTNAVIRQHEVITTNFVPRADLILFITSVDRPFTESERAFLELTQEWGKKVVIVLNKVDILQSEAELAEVQQFVADQARQLFGLVPEIFPLSVRLALRAKLGEPQFWQQSRFEPLESYIQSTLDEDSRLRLKFANPLGVGRSLVDKFLQDTAQRLDLLKTDFARLNDIETQLKLYQEDMQRDFNFRMADIENVLYEMEQRGEDYFDQTIRVSRIFNLLDRQAVQRDFEKQVGLDAPKQIESKVQELIDWLVESDFRQWQSVTGHLADRRKAHSERIVGDPGTGAFHSERDRLLEAVGRQAQRVVETYDRQQEASAIADGAQTAVAALAAVEVGAVGLGTLVTILATTVAADVTGILLASVVAALGLLVIPARRRQAKNDLRQKLTTLRTDLTEALRKQFDQEITRSLLRIREAIAPYTRFIRSEQTKLTETQAQLNLFQNQMEALRTRVNEMGK